MHYTKLLLFHPIVDRKKASRAKCIKYLWEYLKKHNLQDPENKQYFFPDKKMAKVFGDERMRAFTMSKFLGKHLISDDAEDEDDEKSDDE